MSNNYDDEGYNDAGDYSFTNDLDNNSPDENPNLDSDETSNFDNEENEPDEEAVEQESPAEFAIETYNKLQNAEKIMNVGTKLASAGAKISSAVSAAAAFFASTWYIWLILLVLVLIIVLIVVAIGAFAPYSNVDVENGVFNTAQGITGEYFYGARLIYKDNEQAVKDLELYYQLLAIDFLNNIDQVDGLELTINLQFEETRPEQINKMITLIANNMASTETEITLDEALPMINHFGYTTNELSLLNTSLSAFLNINSVSKENYDLAPDSYSDAIIIYDQSIYTGNLQQDLFEIFETNYSYLNTTSPLYYVKDMILSGSDSMLENIGKENFVALIYMPKKDVFFSECSLMFYIDDETMVDVEIINKTKSEENILYHGTADKSWWANSTPNEVAEFYNDDVIGYRFNSIDTGNLQNLNGQNLYQLIQIETNFGIDKNQIEKYFKTEEITFEDNSENYYQISYLPNLDDNYLYVRFNATGKFMFCEENVEIS